MTPDRADGTLVVEKPAESPFGPSQDQEQPQPVATMQAAPEQTAALPQTLLDQAVEQTMKTNPEMRDALAEIRLKESQFSLDQRLASAFAKSQCYIEMKGKSPVESVAIATVKILLGKSMNMSAAESMQAIDVIRGRLAVSAQAQAARMRRAGYDWIFERLDDNGCMLLPMKDGKHIMQVKLSPDGNPLYGTDGLPILTPARVGFTMADAKRAKLVKSDGGYETYPSDMFVARALSRMRRRYAPETLNGVEVSEEVQEYPENREASKPLFAGKESAA